MKQSFENLPAIKEVDEQTIDGFGSEGEKKSEADKDKESEIEKYREEAQKFIDSHKRFLTTFAKDISLRFKVSDGFFIDLEKGEVNLDAEWFAEKGCSQIQILWGCLHELEHFRDLDADPEGVLKNFEYIRVQAKKTGAAIAKKWGEKYGTSDPELEEKLKKQSPINPKKPEEGTMSAVERSAYKIHHTFYNIFDDINDNVNVARKAAAFEKGTVGGQEVEKLYQEKLFAQKDFSKLPRHLQFAYKLIRKEMVPGEEVVLSGEVSEVMERKIQFQGKEYSPREIVENFIKPRKNRDTLARQRHFVLQKTLEPIFAELLMKDLAEWDPQKPQKPDGKSQKGKGEGGSGNPFEENYEDYDKNNPDQISEGDIRGWMDKNNKDKENAEAGKIQAQTSENKTAEERAAEAQAGLDKNWCERNGINPATFRNFKKIEAKVEPYLQDLSRLWQKIIFGSSRKIERKIEGHFKTGAEMDVQKVIEEWPKIQQQKFDDVRVMKRMVSKEILIQKPELIRVRLVGDMSGSMDAKKKHILQQCFALIFSSLREFNTHLNRTRSQTKTKLKVDTEGWVFGSEALQVKKLRSESRLDDEQVEIIKMFEKLEDTLGYTCDYKVLNAIDSSISQTDMKKIDEGKIMEIVFEITDGGSTVLIERNGQREMVSTSTETRKSVDKLLNEKIIARGFQIGETSAEEKRIFNEVWNDGRAEAHGEIVGEEIANLIPAVAAALKKHLSGVKL